MNEAGSIFKKLVIKEIKEVVKDFKLFVFNDDHAVNYASGQYLTLVNYANNEEIRRSYSITSSPFLNEPLSIGVKRIENGFFSRQLVDAAKPGDTIITTGAGGFFTLPENVTEYKHLLFFAAGSGITPIFSIIKSVLHQFSSIKIILVYSNASQEKTVFLQELKQLQKQFPSTFFIEFLFSDAIQLSKARLHRDLLLFYLDKYVKENFGQTLFYICGPENYMRMCTFVLQEADVSSLNIKKENFVIDKIAKRLPAPPDKSTRNVVLHLHKEKFEFAVNYPDSILMAAKKNKISLPYSCEAGRCGSCIAHCIKGKVWLSYNEVLTEKELQKGLTLTCVGHPQNSDVEIEIET